MIAIFTLLWVLFRNSGNILVCLAAFDTVVNRLFIILQQFRLNVLIRHVDVWCVCRQLFTC